MFIRICRGARLAPIFIFLASTLFAASDLEIQKLQAFPDPNAKNIQLKFTWINRGPDGANQPGCNVYVYNNQRLVVSENVPLQPLPFGESREETLKISYPSETVTAVKTEVFDAEEPDLQPSTNSAQINIRPFDFKRADLQILNAELEAEQPLKGKTAVIRLQLRNNGPDLSRNSRLVAELLLFGNSAGKTEKRLQRTAAGEELELKLPYTLPESIPATEGVLRLEWINGNPDMIDPDTQNNSMKIPVSLVAKMPDLAPKDVNVDKRGVLSFSILNKGNSRCGDSITAVYINGALVQRSNTKQLRGGEAQRFQYTAATKVASGSQISIVADFNADVEEASEENNRLNYIVK